MSTLLDPRPSEGEQLYPLELSHLSYDNLLTTISLSRGTHKLAHASSSKESNALEVVFAFFFELFFLSLPEISGSCSAFRFPVTTFADWPLDDENDRLTRSGFGFEPDSFRRWLESCSCVARGSGGRPFSRIYQ